jgi:hypothetical protein
VIRTIKPITQYQRLSKQYSRGCFQLKKWPRENGFQKRWDSMLETGKTLGSEAGAKKFELELWDWKDSWVNSGDVA